MIINSDVHIVTWSLKPVKDSLTSSECPTCNHPVAHVLKAVQYVHLQSWKLIFHSPLQTKFSISLNICEQDLNCWLKIYFHFFVKGLRNNSAALLFSSLRILFSNISKQWKGSKETTYYIQYYYTARWEFHSSVPLISHIKAVSRSKLVRILGRNYPLIWIIKDANPRAVHLALHFSPRILNSEGGNPSTCLTVSFRFFL